MGTRAGEGRRAVGGHRDRTGEEGGGLGADALDDYDGDFRYSDFRYGDHDRRLRRCQRAYRERRDTLVSAAVG